MLEYQVAVCVPSNFVGSMAEIEVVSANV